MRSLPAPPASPARARIIELALQASADGLSAELRRALDTAVFDMFQISPAEGDELSTFVTGLSPRAGLAVFPT